MFTLFCSNAQTATCTEIADTDAAMLTPWIETLCQASSTRIVYIKAGAQLSQNNTFFAPYMMFPINQRQNWTFGAQLGIYNNNITAAYIDFNPISKLSVGFKISNSFPLLPIMHATAEYSLNGLPAIGLRCAFS